LIITSYLESKRGAMTLNQKVAGLDHVVVM